MRTSNSKAGSAMVARAVMAILLVSLILASGCAEQRTLTEYEGTPSERPDYLPEAMFKNLPDMPADFYHVRDLVRTGEIRNLSEVWPEYYLQPEWFPGFEEAGVPLLQNPPENRWGAFGMGSYPSDTVATIVKGDTLTLHFYMRSSYLVETYQGISLVPGFPSTVEIPQGYMLPDGTSVVRQDSSARDYFDISVYPQTFILKPNFPLYSEDGTQVVEVNVTAKEGMPSGSYVLALDAGRAPPDKEEEWIEKYGGQYAVGDMTKIGRPYYRAFITVGEPEETQQES